jgi:hypothetical protein
MKKEKFKDDIITIGSAGLTQCYSHLNPVGGISLI